MRIPTLLLTGLLYIQGAFSQTTTPAGKMASVDVTVTDMQLRPKSGEAVLFRGEKTGKIFTCYSEKNGKAKQLLPQGDSYHVSLKGIGDTTKYAIINVPALGPDEYFTEPFWVNIKFEPARSYTLENVHFDTDKATLRQSSYAELNELLEYLQHHSDIKVEIAGHTDNTGTTAHNLKLSQERANTIRNFLIKKGISPQRVAAKGYGANEPIADNESETGRQLNRRTEVRIL